MSRSVRGGGNPFAPSDEAPLGTTFNILFLCTGNTCRSPMAEAIARDEVSRRGWSHVNVASAGVAVDPGAAASPQALAVVSRFGLDLSRHASQGLSAELVAWADLILAMTPMQADTAAALGGAHKVALLGDFGRNEDGAENAVSDPFGGPEAVYAVTFAELRTLVAGALDRLAPILSP